MACFICWPFSVYYFWWVLSLSRYDSNWSNLWEVYFILDKVSLYPRDKSGGPEGGWWGPNFTPPPFHPIRLFTSFLNSKFFQLKVCILPLILKDLKYGCWEIFLCLSRFWCEKSILVFRYQNLDPPHQISLDSPTVHCIYPFVRAGKRVQSLLPKHRTQYLARALIRIIFTYVFTWWKTLFFCWGRKAAARCWFYLIDLWNIIV